MATLFEQKDERRNYIFRYRIRYHRVVICPWPVLADLLPARGSLMPEKYGGNAAAVLIEVPTTTTTDDGGAQSVLIYELPAVWWQIPRNHGVLTFDVGGDVEEIQEDKDGERVLGEFKEDGVPHRYVVIQGTAFQFIPRCWLTLTVAAESPLVWQLMNLYGKINKNGLPNFGNAQPKTMRFDGVRSSRVLEPNSLYLMKYRLAFEPEGWDNTLKVRKQELELLKQPEVDEDGAATGRIRTVRNWKNDGEIEDRNNYEERDFSILQAIVEW